MKTALIGLLAVAVAAVAIGAYVVLRPDGGDATSGYAKQLDALCLDARSRTEALGPPSSTPMAKLYPGTVKIGRAFLAEVKRLEPAPEQAAAAKTFLEQRGLYYDGLEYAYHFLTVQQNEVAFVRIVNGALSNLVTAETAAKAIGAKECTLRPFE